MEKNKNIDYILDEVIERGYSNNPNDCNDYIKMLQKKDFKDLIALELYETYFWDQRHEFDLQLLKELVENVSAYFSDPNIIMQIQTGLLQTLPSAIIIVIVKKIWGKMKTIVEKHSIPIVENSSWNRIEKNCKKIDKEFSSHDYVITDEIERIFDASREEIQPLLKLCGFKCFIDKKRSIWIKPGLQEKEINEILKRQNFRHR